jgi:hypothetical protein
MNQRERLVNTLRFRTVDRIPFIEGGIRKATMDAWISQGYPKFVPSEQVLDLIRLSEHRSRRG